MGTTIRLVEDRDSDILGFQNPARLSRAGFRVCMLLAQGAGNPAVCTALSLSESTVRAHIRTICIKTGSADRDDLVARLKNNPTAGASVSPSGAGPRMGARVA